MLSRWLVAVAVHLFCPVRDWWSYQLFMSTGNPGSSQAFHSRSVPGSEYGLSRISADVQYWRMWVKQVFFSDLGDEEILTTNYAISMIADLYATQRRTEL